MMDYIRMLRLNICLLSLLGLIVGALIIGVPLIPLTSEVVFAILAAFVLTGAGNVINDYFDYETDKVNRPERPLPSGKISRRSALVLFFVLSLVGLAFSFFVSYNFFLFALVNTIIFTLYPSILKKIPLIKNITVSYLATSPFIAPAFIFDGLNIIIQGPILIFAVIAFLGTLSREIFKDIEDFEGDEKVKIKTLPILIGKHPARILADLILIVATIALAYPIYKGMVTIFYLVGVLPALIFIVYALYSQDITKSQKSIKIAMFLVILGFLLGIILH